MDVQVFKLDDAYKSSEELSVNIKNSTDKISTDLVNVLNNIKLHWRGNDASIHINSLIDEYDSYIVLFDYLSTMSNYCSNYFAVLQRARARMSEKSLVGNGTFIKIDQIPVDKIDGTSEYFYDERLKTDYNDLVELCNFFSKFTDSVKDNFDTILNNWKTGKGRNEIIRCLDSFMNHSTSLIKKLQELKDQIGIVISNEDRIAS